MAKNNQEIFLETINFLKTQQGDQLPLISREELFELLSKENDDKKTPLHFITYKDVKILYKIIALLPAKQSSELLNKKDNQKNTPLFNLIKGEPRIFFDNIEFFIKKREGQSSALISGEQLFDLLSKEIYIDGLGFGNLLDWLVKNNRNNFFTTIKELSKITSIKSGGRDFLNPIFNLFYGKKYDSDKLKKADNPEQKQVQKITQDIYFDSAIIQIVADEKDSDKNRYKYAHYLSKSKEKKLTDCGPFACCLFFLIAGEKLYKHHKHKTKEKALCGFTLPKKPEDMILKYSQHRSPKDILDNYQGADGGFANLVGAINKLKPNNIKKFLQNLYNNDSSLDKSDFKKLVCQISEFQEFGEKVLEEKLKTITLDAENKGAISKRFSFIKKNSESQIKMTDIIAENNKLNDIKAEEENQQDIIGNLLSYHETKNSCDLNKIVADQVLEKLQDQPLANEVRPSMSFKLLPNKMQLY